MLSGCGQPGADVQELPDAHLGDQVADGPAEKLTLGPHADQDVGERGDDLLGRLPGHGEVVLAAEPAVVDPGDVRDGGVEAQIMRLGLTRLGSGVLPVSYHGRPSAGCVGPVGTE